MGFLIFSVLSITLKIESIGNNEERPNFLLSHISFRERSQRSGIQTVKCLLNTENVYKISL